MLLDIFFVKANYNIKNNLIIRKRQTNIDITFDIYLYIIEYICYDIYKYISIESEAVRL